MSEPLLRQAGAVPLRFGAAGGEVLMITSRTTRRWIVPKGNTQGFADETAAALAEAYEEAGVRGRLLGDALGTYDYDKDGALVRVTVFALLVDEVLDDWPERDERTRRWVPLVEAAALTGEPGLAALLSGAAARLDALSLS